GRQRGRGAEAVSALSPAVPHGTLRRDIPARLDRGGEAAPLGASARIPGRRWRGGTQGDRGPIDPLGTAREPNDYQDCCKEYRPMPPITPFLWFDDKAEEAANFYVSVFKNSKVGSVTRYSEESARVSGRPNGSVMTVAFQLDGQEFIALNGGPHFTFTPAISFMVDCKTQAEVDELWGKLSEGGEEVQCG